MYTSDEESGSDGDDETEIAHYMINKYSTRQKCTDLYTGESSGAVVFCPLKYHDPHDDIHCTGSAGGFTLFTALYDHVKAKSMQKCPYHKPLLQVLDEIKNAEVVVRAPSSAAGPSRQPPSVMRQAVSKPIAVEENPMPPRLVLANVPAEKNEVGILKHIVGQADFIFFYSQSKFAEDTYA
eukprot:gene1534-2163_t